MKKLTLLLLLIPILSLSQIIDDKKLGKIDITKIQDEYLTVQLGNFYVPWARIQLSDKKLSLSQRKKKLNAYDNGKLIRTRSKVEILNFFSKYGWEYQDTDTRSSSFTNIATGQVQTSQSVTLTFKNNNN